MKASDLKVKVDQLMSKEGDMTIIKYDPETMYPSIKLKLVLEEVNYFSKGVGK